MIFNRRNFLKALGATTASSALYGCANSSSKASGGHVIVVGGGFGGATIAKYLRLWSAGNVQVTLIERNAQFISCPISNLVISGDKTLADITVSYEGLKKWGVHVVQDEVTGIDAEKRSVHLAQGGVMSYDRLVLSPGVDFMYEQIPGLANVDMQTKILHAWKAGSQTLALRKQLEDMPNGGVYAIAIPKSPYRCPPGPYERASLVAHYCKTQKPKSKVLILDANDEVQSKKALFMKAWAELYPGILEYRPNSELRDVALDRNGTRTALLEFDKVDADVLNVIPPQHAGKLALNTDLKLINKRWVDVDWLTMESTNVKGIHILGDATFSAPGMPKSGHMANQHAKLAAAAIIKLLAGEAPNPQPMLTNTCYSFVDIDSGIHVTSVHHYDAEKKTLTPVAGAGGVSSARSEQEAMLAMGWARNIWADSLA